MAVPEGVLIWEVVPREGHPLPRGKRNDTVRIFFPATPVSTSQTSHHLALPSHPGLHRITGRPRRLTGVRPVFRRGPLKPHHHFCTHQGSENLITYLAASHPWPRGE
ncbi:hypothetical protein AVEN_48651-1 [Araneus ventricosus]|uniref:Uncharacterized protein n=1 Tax=Araneus ventricosus TaxID=182803 RepID=A0A4Y2S9P2_ARAVE|nr:hypothetical protein AVEN_48651-1 [Araneus ventricosus]